MKLRAFTLIELLIVVAIIAILAAIAVPNFLEAQTRAKVARVVADIRSIATAMETYRIDTNAYPPDNTRTDGKTIGAGLHWYTSNPLTTPIAYISNNLIVDPFRKGKDANLPEIYRRYRYINYGMAGYYEKDSSPLPAGITVAMYKRGRTVFGDWRLTSSGPDGSAGSKSGTAAVYYPTADTFVGPLVVYDASNGTVSGGDVIRSQKEGDHKTQKYP